MLPPQVRFDRAGYWADVLKRQFSVHKGAVTCDHYTSVRLGGDSGAGDTRIMVETAGIEGQAGLYGCLATQVLSNTYGYALLTADKVVRNTRVCSEARAVTGSSRVLPGRRYRSSALLSALLSNTLTGAVSGGRRCWTPRIWRTPAGSPSW